MNVGDRVKVKMEDANGNSLYGTILDNNILGIAVLVKVDTPVSKKYCYTDSDEVVFIRSNLEVINDSN